MKRMYRIAALLLLFVLLLGITAQADVIWTTRNEFYNVHKKDCDEHHRVHYINAKKGALGVYAEPNGKEVLHTLKNGSEVGIYYTYDNATWGLVYGFVYESDEWVEGWIRLDQTVVKYNNQNFMEDYAAQFYDDTDYISRTMLKDIKKSDRIYGYQYPGGETHFRPRADQIGILEDDFKFEHLFEDENGRLWGYWGKSHGNDWMCLSDPQNPDLPEIVRQELDLYPASDIEIKSEYIPPWLLPTSLVVGVAAISSVLLIVLKRRKEKEV